MRLVFCGTPEFAVRTLEAVLSAGHEIALVVTQPDRPAGRGLDLIAPAVKRLAVDRNLTVAQPDRIRNNDAFRQQLEAIAPDAILVVAYGRIIPPWMLDLPRFGCLNLHGSLLPKYRGAAPIQWAVASGDLVTGVTTMRLDAGLDTGPMLLAHAVPIAPEETAEELYRSLAATGATLMVDTLGQLERGTLTPTPQDHTEATIAPILTREDGRVSFADRTAKQIYDRWRGFTPWPGAFTEFRGKRFLLSRMHLPENEIRTEHEPGYLQVASGALIVSCANGTHLALDEVQIEGKPRLSGPEFAKSFLVKTGDRLG